LVLSPQIKRHRHSKPAILLSLSLASTEGDTAALFKR